MNRPKPIKPLKPFEEAILGYPRYVSTLWQSQISHHGSPLLEPEKEEVLRSAFSVWSRKADDLVVVVASVPRPSPACGSSSVWAVEPQPEGCSIKSSFSRECLAKLVNLMACISRQLKPWSRCKIIMDTKGKNQAKS